MKELPLVNSHIIPEFMYKGLYDEKHRFFVLSSDPADEEKMEQKGLRERLLCSTCDNEILGRYEKYADKVIYKRAPSVVQQTGKLAVFTGLDYCRLKLFFLSVFWRMDLATHRNFGEIKLGPYREVIRQQLISGKAGPSTEFGMATVAPLFDGEHLGDWITHVHRGKYHGRRLYACVIGGLLYVLFVGGAELPKGAENWNFQEDGTWTIYREKIENIPHLMDWVLTMAQADAQRNKRN